MTLPSLPMPIDDCRSLALVVSADVADAAEQACPVTFRRMADGRFVASASVLSETGQGQTYEPLAAMLGDAELVPMASVVGSIVDPPAGGSSPSVPTNVSARQIRLWLVRHGIPLASVDAAIDSIADQATRDVVRVEWEWAPYIERSHPWLVPLAQALGLDEAGVDAAFREAFDL